MKYEHYSKWEYLTPITQKRCRGCGELIKDIRDHITCVELASPQEKENNVNERKNY